MGSSVSTVAVLTGCDGMRLPATAERLVERHWIGELRRAHGHQPLLSAVERALGVEGSQVVVDARSEAHLREPVGIGVGRNQRLLRAALVDVSAAGAEGVRDLAEGGLDSELVLRDGDILLDVRQVEVRAVLTSREDRESDRWGEAPRTRARAEEVLQPVACRAAGCSQ